MAYGKFNITKNPLPKSTDLKMTVTVGECLAGFPPHKNRINFFDCLYNWFASRHGSKSGDSVSIVPNILAGEISRQSSRGKRRESPGLRPDKIGPGAIKQNDFRSSSDISNVSILETTSKMDAIGGPIEFAEVFE